MLETGFSDDDLAKLWQALMLMFEHDRSAARGEMAARKLIVFKHDSVLGSQPAHKLFDAVKVERINGESGTPASGFGDYNISVVSDGLNVCLLIDIDLQLHCQIRLQPVPDKLPLRWQTESRQP